MKTIQFGNVVDIERGIIVHGCNAQGKMNSGVAKDVRHKYPQVFDAYEAHHLQGGLMLGMIIPVEIKRGLWVVNGITQLNYGKDGEKYVSYEALHAVFTQVAELAKDHFLDVNYPMIGAGLGGGDWALISDIIDVTLKGVNHHFWIYEK